MSSSDSGPPAQRRRKLVLRKIPPAGPLPVVRPPQKSIPFASVVLSPDAEAAAAITSLPSREVPPPAQRLPVAEAPARPAPADPQPSGQQAPRISHAFLPRAAAQPSASWASAQEAPLPYAPPSPPRAPASDTGARATVAPVVASARSAHAHAESARSPWARFARASTRASTLLVAGGALAAMALFATLGVEVGERSGRPAPSPASLQAVSPAVVETGSSIPVVGAARKTAPSSDRRPAEQAASPVILQAETTTIEAPPMVHVAPAAAAATALPKGPAAAPATAMSGWAIASATPATRPQPASEASAQAARLAVDSPGSPAASAASAPEIPSSPPPAVDPLVQAVREDIREDEARSK